MPYADPIKQKEYVMNWHKIHRETRNKQSRERYWTNHESERLRSKLKYIRDKDKKKQYQKEHKEDRKNWYQMNKKECYQKYVKKWRAKGHLPILDNPFPEDVSVHYHHILPDFCLTIPLPDSIHNQFRGEAHYVHCNEWIEKIYCMDINSMLL
jgi:hypothetical protein